MPYPSEHAARIKDPNEFKRFRRENDKFGPGIDVIWGINQGKPVEIQAIRFSADKFTPSQAKSWLKAHDYSPIEFAPAAETQTTNDEYRSMTLVLNSAAGVRRETFEGRPHVVVPSTILVEGVHKRKLYRASLLERAPHMWDGFPVVVQHPRKGGVPINANDPEVLSSQGIGRMFHTKFDRPAAALKTETWIDEDRGRKIAPTVMDDVEAGRSVELSTGLYSAEDPVGGVFNGEEYDAEILAMAPNHLAVLPDRRGACSLEDGCGLNVNVAGSARTPSYSGTESTSWAGVDKSFGAYRSAYAAEPGSPAVVSTDVKGATKALKSWVASKTLLGDPSADTEGDLIFFPVVNPKTGKLNEGALRAVLGGRSAQAKIPDSARKSAQDKARSLLNSEFGAKLSANDESSRDIEQKAASVVCGMSSPQWNYWLKDVYPEERYVVYGANRTKPGDSGVCGPWMAADAYYMQSYDVDSATGELTLVGDPQEVRENKTWEPVPPEPGPQTMEQGVSKKERRKMPDKDKVDKLIACPCTPFGEPDRTTLLAMDEGAFSKVVALADAAADAKRQADERKAAEDQAARKAIEEEEARKRKEIEDAEANKGKDPVVAYVEAAPPEVSAVLNEGIRMRKARKESLVNSIVANDSGKVFKREALEAKSPEELEAIAAYGRVTVNYAGAPAPEVNGESRRKRAPIWDVPGSR